MKCIFFGIVAVIVVTTVSFEVFPLTAIPLTTIIKKGQDVDNIYGIYIMTNGQSEEDEHNIGLVSSTVVTASRNSNSNTYIEISKDTKLVHQGFRIKKHVLKALDKQAEKNGISLSNLVNKILENYVDCDMYFEELGFILVSKNFLRNRFSKIEEEKYLIEEGKEFGLLAAKEYLPYLFNEINSNTLIQFLEIWFKRFECCQHRINGDDNNSNQYHYFVVHHDININFSIALKGFLQGLVEPIIRDCVTFNSLTSNAIAFSFKNQS